MPTPRRICGPSLVDRAMGSPVVWTPPIASGSLLCPPRFRWPQQPRLDRFVLSRSSRETSDSAECVRLRREERPANRESQGPAYPTRPPASAGPQRDVLIEICFPGLCDGGELKIVLDRRDRLAFKCRCNGRGLPCFAPWRVRRYSHMQRPGREWWSPKLAEHSASPATNYPGLFDACNRPQREPRSARQINHCQRE